MTTLETAEAGLLALIGQEVGLSAWIEVDQDMIDQFAETTRDAQWIHVDPKRAAQQSPFGTTVAHGFLTLSLASRMSYECKPLQHGQRFGLNYGFDRIRFLTPVRAGDRVRGRFTLAKATRRKPGELLLRLGLSIEIEDRDSSALVADWLTLSLFDLPRSEKRTGQGGGRPVMP